MFDAEQEGDTDAIRCTYVLVDRRDRTEDFVLL